MPKPQIIKPPVLRKDVALQVADVAGVPPEERDQFCELVQGTVQTVWELDRRAVSSKPGQALIDAAHAARTLHKALGSLNKEDREWVEKLLTPNPWYGGELRELPLTVWRLAHLFSTAIGKSLSGSPVQATSSKKRGWRQRTVKDATFQNLVTHLLVDAETTGGKLTYAKASGRGTLIEALDVLTPHLPKGVVPSPLPLGTIQKIKTKYRDFYAGSVDFDRVLPKSGRRRKQK